MKFILEYEGWIEIDADSLIEAEQRGFDILNAALSPICDGGASGDWEAMRIEES